MEISNCHRPFNPRQLKVYKNTLWKDRREYNYKPFLNSDGTPVSLLRRMLTKHSHTVPFKGNTHMVWLYCRYQAQAVLILLLYYVPIQVSNKAVRKKANLHGCRTMMVYNSLLVCRFAIFTQIPILRNLFEKIAICSIQVKKINFQNTPPSCNWLLCT